MLICHVSITKSLQMNLQKKKKKKKKNPKLDQTFKIFILAGISMSAKILLLRWI